MPLLSDTEKTELRQSLIEPGEEILAEAADILRRSETANGYGAITESYNSVGEAACLISKESAATDGPEGGEVQNGQLYRITFLDTADIRKTDRLQIGSRLYEVVSDPSLGTYSIISRILAKQII